MTYLSPRTLYIILTLLFCSRLNAQWVPTGFDVPSSLGIYQICQKDNVIMITTGNSNANGILRSKDGGKTWDKANNGIQTDNDLILPHKIVASKTNNNFFCLIVSDVYMSADLGDNWELISDYNKTGGIQEIECDLYGSLIAAADNGVFSTRTGTSWNDLNFGNDLTNKFVSEIEIDKSNVIYALRGNSQRDRIYKFDDDNNVWNSTSRLPSGGQIKIFRLNSDGNIFVCDYDNNFFRSLDGGNSWETLTGISENSYFIKNFIITPDDKIILEINNQKLLLSSNKGNSWQTIYENSVDDIFSTDDGNIYANIYSGGEKPGVVFTRDQGKTWDTFNFLYVPVSNILIRNDNRIFAASSQEHKGLYSSSDKGNTWENLEIPDIVFSAKSISSNAGGRIVFCDNYRTHISIDDGVSWNTYSLGTGNSNSVTGGLILPDNTILVGGISSAYTTTTWLARSTNDGQTWEYITDITYQSFIQIKYSKQSNSIFALTASYSRPGMSGGTSYVLRSINNGNNWEEVYSISNYSGSNYEWFKSIGCRQDGTIFLSSDKALYRSSNNGSDWTKIDSLLSHTNFTNFVFDSQNNIYAYNENGIYKSNDNGIIWTIVDTAMQITAVDVSPDNFLYIGTKDRGIFTNDSSILSSKHTDEIPDNFLLQQNFPNPFNPTTKIEYSVPRKSFVTLKIYDTLGRTVAILVSEEKSPGNYEITFNGKGLASGVYLYNLQSGSFSETKKLVLIK